MTQPIDLKLVGGLKLNELLRSLEEDDYLLPPEINIAMLPPINSTEDLTDEDSGDEDYVNLNNLPGSQLLAPATLLIKDSDIRIDEDDDENSVNTTAVSLSDPRSNNLLENWDEEDDIPLSIFQAVKKSYKWSETDLSVPVVQWPVMYSVKNELTAATDLFLQIFDEDTIDMFVFWSNNYASKKNRSGNITQEEMYAFFGILLLSGYVPVPRRRMFWEQRKDAHNYLVASALSRDRFEFIVQNLHCCDNDHLDPSDKFTKVRPLFDKLNKKFQEYAPFCETHSVDESMIPYFGRHGCKQFIKGKPVRYGFKIWMGATSTGYTLWIDPYQGANSKVDAKYKLFGLGPSIILQYADVLKSIGEFPFLVFFDNFFTTVPLLEELQKRQIKATGTIRENRMSKCPILSKAEIKKKDRGAMDFRSSDNKVIVVKWHDNNTVNIASNALPVHPVSHVSRYSQKEKKRINIPQPYLFQKYNSFMGGVDRCDQNLSLYRTAIRGKKWYFPIIMYCLDLAEQNAWQLHRHQGGKMDHLNFRRTIVETLLEKYKNSGKKRGRPNSFEHLETRLDNRDHYIVPQPKQTRCRVCHKKVQRKCHKCEVALHVECFVTYHHK